MPTVQIVSFRTFKAIPTECFAVGAQTVNSFESKFENFRFETEIWPEVEAQIKVEYFLLNFVKI